MKIILMENSLQNEIEQQGILIQNELQNAYQNLNEFQNNMSLDPFDILELKRQEMMTGIFGHLAQFLGNKFGLNMGVYTTEEIPEKNPVSADVEELDF